MSLAPVNVWNPTNVQLVLRMSIRSVVKCNNKLACEEDTMGSAAPKPTQYDPARSLLQLLLVHVRAHAHRGEPDFHAMKDALDAALDDPIEGDIIRFYLAAYLGRCLADSIPDHTVWEPR